MASSSNPSQRKADKPVLVVNPVQLQPVGEHAAFRALLMANRLAYAELEPIF